jgi:hypothetical protein
MTSPSTDGHCTPAPQTLATRLTRIMAFLPAKAYEGLTCTDTIAATPPDQRQHDETQVRVHGTVDEPRFV